MPPTGPNGSSLPTTRGTDIVKWTRGANPIAASITGTSTSLMPPPCQRATDRAIDTLPASSRLASSTHANGVGPATAIAGNETPDGAARSLRLGGAGGFFLCCWLLP
jgi:hypothetical protein